jgi:hypothetical protein
MRFASALLFIVLATVACHLGPVLTPKSRLSKIGSDVVAEDEHDIRTTDRSSPAPLLRYCRAIATL